MLQKEETKNRITNKLITHIRIHYSLQQIDKNIKSTLQTIKHISPTHSPDFELLCRLLYLTEGGRYLCVLRMKQSEGESIHPNQQE